jgi:hypothetical protein
MAITQPIPPKKDLAPKAPNTAPEKRTPLSAHTPLKTAREGDGAGAGGSMGVIR